MATYVSLFKYNGNVEGGGPERFAEVQQVTQANGGKITAVYGLLGEYDVMSVTEFPDAVSAMRAVGKVCNIIGARSQTMEAIDQNTFIKLLTEM